MGEGNSGTTLQRRLDIVLCGPPTVRFDDGPAVSVRGRQPQVVLAYLALAGRPVDRDELAHLLWPDLLPDHWTGALRGVLSKVRAALVAAGGNESDVRSEMGTVALSDACRVTTDVARARSLLDEAARSLDLDLAQEALDQSVAARSAIRGAFVPHHDSDWGRRQRELLDEMAARASHLEVKALLHLQRFDDAASHASSRVTDAPLDEEAHHLLITALLAGGQRGQAVSAFARLTQLLDEEFGLAPARRTAVLVDPPNRAAIEPRPYGRRATDRPVRPSARPRHSSAPSYHPHDREPFVGRHDQLAALWVEWDRAVSQSQPRMVIIEGPPGMGKTRLASRFAAEVARAGARLMWGRARDGAGRAYGPFAEAIDATLGDDPGMIAQLGALATGLVPLIPRLADHIPGYVAPADDAVSRTQLFGAVTATLASLATEPTLLVLDDLHWSSEDSLALLESALDGAHLPLLVLATARPRLQALGPSLMALQRNVPVTRIVLHELDTAEIDELVGGDDHELALSIYRQTGGLPFYVAELARTARQTGAQIDTDQIPVGVRDWVARRLTVLSAESLDLLSLAAVVGMQVDLDVLEACTSNPDSVIELYEDLVSHGLLADESEHIEFPHAITREVVYQNLKLGRRARLHRRVADAIVEQAEQFGTAVPHGEVAEHYERSGPSGRRRASHHGCRAGQEALSQGAWELAAASFELARRCADEPTDQTQALIGLGQARHQLGEREEARRLISEAAELARRHHLPAEQARAGLALVGRAGRGASSRDDQWQVEVLREALDSLTHAIESGDRRECEALACHVERELALALLLTPGSAEERTQLLDRSIARARTLDPPDDSALAAALLGLRIIKLDGDALESRLADLDEVLAIPRSRLNPELAVAAHAYRHEDLLRAAKHEAARRALDEACYLADHYRFPYWQWATTTWKGLAANIAGDLDVADKLAAEALTMRADVAEAVACYGVNQVNLALYDGRADEVLDLLGAAVAANTQIPAYRAVLALCATEAGELAMAADAYRFFAREEFANLPVDTNRFLGLAVLADVAVELGDRDGGRRLAELLAPTRGQWVQINCYGGGGAHWGPVSHHLAGLAALDGRAEEAGRLIEEAENQARHAPLVVERIRRDAGRWL